MAITSVYRAIRRHLRTVSVSVYSSGTYVEGEWQESITASQDMSLAVFPITERELKFLPEGAYSSQDRSVYEIGGPGITLKSTMEFDGAVYLFDRVSDRDHDGGYTKYICRRVPEAES